MGCKVQPRAGEGKQKPRLLFRDPIVNHSHSALICPSRPPSWSSQVLFLRLLSAPQQGGLGRLSTPGRARWGSRGSPCPVSPPPCATGPRQRGWRHTGCFGRLPPACQPPGNAAGGQRCPLLPPRSLLPPPGTPLFRKHKQLLRTAQPHPIASTFIQHIRRGSSERAPSLLSGGGQNDTPPPGG